MGIFNFFRKKKQNCVLDELKQADDIGDMAVILAKSNIISAPKDENHNSFGEDLRHLTADGELPFGWVSHRKSIIDQIDTELSVFRKAIYEAETPEESIAAINDYFQYLEDGKSITPKLVNARESSSKNTLSIPKKLRVIARK